LEKFRQLGADHQGFHALVSEIVHLWNGGRQAEARQRFEKLIPQTTNLFTLLDELSLDAAHSTAKNDPGQTFDQSGKTNVGHRHPQRG
jgi:hypothetical protein